MKGMRETDTHIYFWGGIYSQWYKTFIEAPHHVHYNCAEQYMMVGKAHLFGDEEAKEKIWKLDHPADQQMAGRRVKNYNQEKWDEKKFDIVVRGNVYKFMSNPDLKKQLLATGDKIIVEGSPTDTVWGVGLHYANSKIEDEKNWDGENLLGKAIMKARELINLEDEK